MKLRIRDNSIRLRLSRGEVESFGSSGSHAAQIAFPGGAALSYTVKRADDASALDAWFVDSAVTILVPGPLADEWVGSDKVGIAGEVPLDGGDALSVLIEKDFQCLTERPGESEADMYPHPGACTGHGHGHGAKPEGSVR